MCLPPTQRTPAERFETVRAFRRLARVEGRLLRNPFSNAVDPISARRYMGLVDSILEELNALHDCGFEEQIAVFLKTATQGGAESNERH